MSLLKADLVDGKFRRFDGDLSLWRKQGIYRITCLANGLAYYGSCSGSKGMGLRFSQHVHGLRRASNRHPNPIMLRDWKRYGEASFLFEILEVCDPSECLGREQHYLDRFGIGEENGSYNLCPIAGNSLGAKLSEETRRKISESLKGNQRRKGIPHSAESLAKMSASRKGKTRNFTEAHRAALSKAIKAYSSQPHVKEKFKKQACVRTYKITSPEGVVFECDNLLQFCKDYSLSNTMMNNVARGKCKAHKGWTCEYTNTRKTKSEKLSS